jgi:DNA-binding transcriptional LysR family regulator
VELRDLEYFLACSRTANFTTAAREVHIVQSGMSAAMARLEKDLGVALFDRSTTPLTLTHHGATFQDSARRILDAVQAARDDVAAVDGEVRGTVTVGCTLNTGPLDMAAVLTGLRRQHPEVVVHLRQFSSGSTGNIDALIEGTADIALTANPGAATAEALELHPLVDEPLVFLCRPDHRLAARSSISAGDLEAEEILRFPPGWGVSRTVDTVLGRSSDAMEVADYTLMASLIRAGFGTALAPESAAPGRRGLARVTVEDPRARWRLFAAVSPVRRAGAATRVVLDALVAGGAG